ncbi:T-complex protein 1 subunit eta [Parelaphostrongylus tenuis]|uniref:T-complex protein 1 subunit eta n=1 Tax=Parelaphostrongylus tenuis TaxID=148309 RepID=A0AAD5RA23_PARTN|nr:T-complex protein 1 subunit eta [Parelaphostrongylus tenuis]
MQNKIWKTALTDISVVNNTSAPGMANREVRRLNKWQSRSPANGIESPYNRQEPLVIKYYLEESRDLQSTRKMMRPPIILLKEGTENKQGKQQIISNINACQVVADSIRTTLGPRGLDKLIVDSKGNTTISNDGATILKLLDIVFPAAKVMVDIAKSQDAEVGDGTTSVVVLAAEILKRMKPFIEDGVHPQLLIRAVSRASEEALSRLSDSKLVSQEREFFAEMVVDAVNILDESLPINMIGIKKVSGGNLNESRLVKGVAFQKAFSYAGFEMQPKYYQNPLVALLNIELELKAEKDNAEMRLTSVDDFQAVVDAEWNILYEKLQKIYESGAKVVLSKLPIGDVATQWFADRDLFCAGRIPQDDLDRVMAACGGSILTTVSQIDKSVLGKCDTFYEQQVGNERYNFFEGCARAHACTLLLRGGAEQFIAETERSLHDAIMIVRRAKKNDSIVAGGGAIEMELSRHLRAKAKTIAGKEQFFWSAFARSFEIIPQQLCYNAGIDAIDILNKLRHRHSMGEIWAGVDVHKEEVGDNLAACIWEPSLVKRNAIIAAQRLFAWFYRSIKL